MFNGVTFFNVGQRIKMKKNRHEMKIEGVDNDFEKKKKKKKKKKGELHSHSLQGDPNQ
jgi:hypothetical protein